MIKYVKGKIRIVTIPCGESPLEIRKMWVGCGELLVHFIHDEGSQGILTGKQGDTKVRYWVDQEEALEILSRVHPDTAEWWYRNGFPKQDRFFGFLEDEVEVVGELEEVCPQCIVFLELLDKGDTVYNCWRNICGGRN